MFWFLVILVILAAYTISTRNKFAKLQRAVKEAGGNIGVYIAKRSQCLKDALNVAKISYSHEVEGIEKLTAQDQLDQLAYLGQKYPALQSTGNYSVAVENAFALNQDIAATRVLLNSNIREYNNAISAFPALIIAGIFKYKEEKFVDEDNIEENKKLDKSDVDFSQF